MAWSTVTAGGSDTTWSGVTAGGSDTTWSNTTAGGSATTWSNTTAGGSDTTWDAAQGTPNAASWIPYATITDLSGGADFVPKATNKAALGLDSTRPAVVWDKSSITASDFTAEGAP